MRFALAGVAPVAAAIAAALALPARAAPVRTLRGVVIEQGTPTPIAGASVLTDRGATAITDIDGYFSLDLAAGDTQITIVATGYAILIVPVAPVAPVAPGGAAPLRLALVPASGAEVIEVRGKTPEQTTPLSYQLTVDEIRTIPGAGNDILRATTVLPGVARIPFSFGGLVLRGAAPRDSAVYLDGIEVPIAFHFGGLTSFYPSGMLQDLTLTAGGYDASYGRAQGGLVTITTREPRTDRWRLGGSIGLFDSSVQAEGPVRGGGGIIMGVRRSYFDAIAAPFVADDVPLPSYLDLQIRATWGDPRRRGRLTPMIFGSLDRVANDDVAITSAFLRIGAPYLRIVGATTLRVVPWLGTNRLSFSDRAEVDENGDPTEQTFSRPEYRGGVRAEVTRDTDWGHLRGGAELSSGYLAQTRINVDLDIDDNDTGDGDRSGHTTLAWSDIALWSEVRWKLASDRLSIKPGLRIEAYGLSGQLAIDPRLNITQQLTPELALRQAVGRYHQPPTPGDVDPEGGNPALDGSYADQLSVGLDAELPHAITASVTGFYSDQRHNGVQEPSPADVDPVPEPNLGGLGPTFQLLLEKQLGIAIYREAIGRGTNVGVELSVKRNVRGLFTLLSYTLARAERVDDPRTGILRRPFELDQRHNLQVVASKQWKRWKLGARLQIVSGNPYSPVVLDADGNFTEEPFAGRLPMFFSLDVRADRRWHRCWGDIVLFFDIQNVTNRRNIEGRDSTIERESDVRGLPIIPFIGVEFLPTI